MRFYDTFLRNQLREDTAESRQVECTQRDAVGYQLRVCLCVFVFMHTIHRDIGCTVLLEFLLGVDGVARQNIWRCPRCFDP